MSLLKSKMFSLWAIFPFSQYVQRVLWHHLQYQCIVFQFRINLSVFAALKVKPSAAAAAPFESS
jgi:hypothetical protein